MGFCIRLSCADAAFTLPSQNAMCIEEELKTKGFDSEASKASVNILFTAGWLHARINNFLRDFGLSHEQYNVLRILRGQHPKSVPQKDILERMINRCSNLTPIIAKLKEKQLVQVSRAEDDRREYRICITDEALRILTQISSRLESDTSSRLNISAEEATLLNQLLDKIRQVP
jgi:DNA-binding MarR family transcriptional regulator